MTGYKVWTCAEIDDLYCNVADRGQNFVSEEDVKYLEHKLDEARKKECSWAGAGNQCDMVAGLTKELKATKKALGIEKKARELMADKVHQSGMRVICKAVGVASKECRNAPSCQICISEYFRTQVEQELWLSNAMKLDAGELVSKEPLKAIDPIPVAVEVEQENE